MTDTRTSIYTLVNLFHLVETGRIAVPNFQRGYVWGKEQVRQLFISINSGYPIGTLLAVEAEEDRFQGMPAERSLFPSPAQVPEDRYRLWLVDGAQRLAALYNGFFTTREQFELAYDLRRREFYSSAQARSVAPLLKMSSLFSSTELMSLQAGLATKADGEVLLAELNAIRERFYSYSIPLVVISGLEDFEVVDIFARLNSTGSHLTKKDLAGLKKRAPRRR
jgi:hypothetical protein